MTALTANANIPHLPDQELREFLVGAAEHIYQGGFVGVDPAGYAKAFVPGDLFVGIAYEEVNNSAGAAGADKVRVYTVGDFELALTTAAHTDTGKPVYATDDATLGRTGHPDAFVGTVVHKDADTAGYVIVRLRQPGQRAPVGEGSIDIDVDFSKSQVVAQDESVATLTVAGSGLKTAAVGAGLTAGTTGILMDEATGEVRLLIDNDNEAENLTIETPQVFNITKGATFEFTGKLEAAGGAATDDFDFGLMGLSGGITATERADMDAATAGLLSCKFHVDTNGLDLKASSDDNASPIAAADTEVNVVLQTAFSVKLICRPTGLCEVWVNGVRKLSTTAFSVGASGLLAGIVNIEKSTGTGVPEIRMSKLRVAGAIA